MCEVCVDVMGCRCVCRYAEARKRVSEAGVYAEVEVYCAWCGHELGEVPMDD